MANPVRTIGNLLDGFREERRRKREREEKRALYVKELEATSGAFVTARAELFKEQQRLFASGAEIAPPWVLETNWGRCPQREAQNDPLVRGIWEPYIRAMTSEQRVTYFQKWPPPLVWRPAIYDYLRDIGDPLWGDPAAALRYGDTEEAGDTLDGT